MKQLSKYDEWLSLSDENRIKIMRSWNPYEKEGGEFAKIACERFKETVKDIEEIEDISFGIYHGGLWIISVAVKKGTKIKVPEFFEGFPILVFHR